VVEANSLWIGWRDAPFIRTAREDLHRLGYSPTDLCHTHVAHGPRRCFRVKPRTANSVEAPGRLSAAARFGLLLGGSYWRVSVLMVASVVAGLIEAAILAAVAQAAAALVDGARRVVASIGPLHVNESITALLAVTFGLAVVRLVLQAPLSILPSRIVSNVAAKLQRDSFAAFTRASWAEKASALEGHLQELLSNQIWQASQGSVAATSLVSSALTLLALVFSALLLNVVAAATVLVLAVLLFAVLRPLNQLTGRRARGLSQAGMNFANGVGEAARLAEETQVFGVGVAQRQRIDKLVEQMRGLNFRTQALGRLVPNVYQSVVYLIVVAGLAGLHAANAGHVASLGAVVLLLVRAGTYGQAVQGSYMGVRGTWPYFERVMEAQRRYLASMPTTGNRDLSDVRKLAFESISYAYVPGRRVLSGITFDVAAGETVGIVGPSGAGKSTLVQLLLGLRVADEGCYLVNDVPVEQFSGGDWCARFAYVPQEPRLMHASVADNISYFRTLDHLAVERAARLARIHDDILTWSHGYDTLIGPRADAVSGGQQQRICIARALAAQPEVLVLDEPTSSLDPQSESLLQQSLLGLKGEITLFIVAHRITTLDICDRVMVITNGQLEAFDTIDHLKQQNAYYRHASALAAGNFDTPSA
jgi:ATP-binding cassette subfamily B protein